MAKRGIAFVIDALLAAILLVAMLPALTGAPEAPSLAEAAIAFDALSVLDADGTLQTLNESLVERGLERCLWGSQLKYNASVSVHAPGGASEAVMAIQSNANKKGNALMASREFAVFNGTRIAYYGSIKLWVWK